MMAPKIERVYKQITKIELNSFDFVLVILLYILPFAFYECVKWYGADYYECCVTNCSLVLLMQMYTVLCA